MRKWGVCEGEASAGVRKAKFICLFDWEKITCKWVGNVAGLDTTFKGTVVIGGYDHDTESSDELDFTFRWEENGPPRHPALYDLMRKKMPEAIWKAFELYHETLRKDFARKLAFSKDSENPENGSTQPILQKKSPTAIKLDSQPNTIKAKNPPATSGTKINTKKITLKESFMGTCQDVYTAFVDVNRIRVWSSGSLKVTPPDSLELEKDVKFELYSGNVKGEVTKLKHAEEISMKWRYNKWPSGHFSNVILKFESSPGGTDLRLEQTQVPSEFVEYTTQGWRRFYFAEIKQKMGLGMPSSFR